MSVTYTYIEVFPKDDKIIILWYIAAKRIMLPQKPDLLWRRSVIGYLARNGLLVMQHLFE